MHSLLRNTLEIEGSSASSCHEGRTRALRVRLHAGDVAPVAGRSGRADLHGQRRRLDARSVLLPTALLL